MISHAQRETFVELGVIKLEELIAKADGSKARRRAVQL